MKPNLSKKIIIPFVVSVSFVIILIFFSIMLANQKTVHQEINRSVNTNLQYSTQLTYEVINYFNAISQQILYDGSIEKIYDKFLLSANQDKLKSDISSALTVKQYPFSEILMSCVYFDNDPNTIYFSDKNSTANCDIYKNDIHSIVRKNLASGSSNVFFLFKDNNFYIYRNLINTSTLEKYGGYVMQVDINYIVSYLKAMVSPNLFVKLIVNDQTLYITLDKNKQIKIISAKDMNVKKLEHEITSVSEKAVDGRSFNLNTAAYADNVVLYNYEYQLSNFYLLIIILLIVFVCYFIFRFIYKNEMLFLDIKVKSLQAQINPHFLNNAFEIINWTARIDGNEEISKMIESLSTVINSGLDNEDNKFNSLSIEMDIVDSYLFLIEKRFSDSMKIEKHVDENLLNEDVPKLTLQPIVENAIIHGVEKNGEGTIVIRIFEQDDCIIIEVENEGEPLGGENIDKINSLLKDKDQASQIGINNVDTRLKYIYGTNFGLVIHQTESNKTLSTVKIPIKHDR